MLSDSKNKRHEHMRTFMLWSYGSLIYNYLWISAYHHWSCEFRIPLWRDVLDTTLCDKDYQWLATCRWFSTGTLVSSTNNTDHHDITETLFKVALNIITYPIPHKIVLSLEVLFLSHFLYITEHVLILNIHVIFAAGH